MNPLVLIVGRVSPEAKNVRGEPFAAGRRYFHAVARAGGTPLMLPPILDLVDDVPDLMRRIDALVLPAAATSTRGTTASRRPLRSCTASWRTTTRSSSRWSTGCELDLPMLAICRGMQVLNVAMGGTLQQHIGSEDHWFEYTHVELEAGSHIAKAIGNMNVTSCHCVHHQASTGRRRAAVTGPTPDGIVHEAEVSDGSWIVATQWHPGGHGGAPTCSSSPLQRPPPPHLSPRANAWRQRTELVGGSRDEADEPVGEQPDGQREQHRQSDAQVRSTAGARSRAASSPGLGAGDPHR